jgi:4-amino-4-deoxy-L-arabinose transferase-like glycosyltransferase
MMSFIHRIPRAHAWVAIAAIALYLPAFWWGVPHATAPDRAQSWGVDDATPLGPLAEVHGLFLPSPERNLGYPLLHPLVVASTYAPYLGYLFARGDFHHPSGTFPFGLRDPAAALRNLGLLAHLVAVLFGAGVAVAAYDAGCALWDRRTGFFSAAFAATAFPMFYYSRTGNVDVPVLFFTAATLAVFARCLAGEFTMQRALWLGLFGGCALGVKEPALASFLALPFLLLWIQRRHSNSARDWTTLIFWKAPLVSLASLLFAFGLGGGFFLDPNRFLAHVQFVRERLSADAGGTVVFVQTFPWTWDGNLALAQALCGRIVDSMTIVGALLALAGFVWVLRSESFKALFFLPAVTYIVVLSCSARVVQLRYLMPAVLTLAFFAARSVTLAMDSHRRWLAAVFTCLAFGALGLSLLRGADLTYSMLRDSRYAAGEWLAGHAAAGDRVEFFGPTQKLPPLARGVISERAIVYLGAIRKPNIGPEAVEEILDHWRKIQPKFILSIPDHSSPPGYLDSATCPPPVLDALVHGTAGYRLVVAFETPALLSWVGRPALDYPTVNPPIHIYERMQNTPEAR